MLYIGKNIISYIIMRSTTFGISELTEGQNEFILTSNPSRIGATSLDVRTKDQLITKLKNNNKRLKNEIAHIQQVLQSTQKKVSYGNKLPQLKSEVAAQQLENAYKQIKSYELQIQKLSAVKSEGPFLKQVRKLQKFLNEKETIADKLRKDIIKLKRQTADYAKYLQNHNKKTSLSNKMDILNSQVKWLREKVKEAEQKKAHADHNRQRQKFFINKVQSQLLKEGYARQQLNKLKNNYNPNHTTNFSFASEDQKYRTIGHIDGRNDSRKKKHFDELLSQIKLFKKLEKNYEDQMETIEKDKQTAQIISLKSRRKLEQTQYEISKTEMHISHLKLMIDPKNMRPNKKYLPQNQSQKPLEHVFKTEEIGNASKGGKLFSDRQKIGKYNAKIVGIDFYTSKDHLGYVLGMQTTYEVNSIIKKGAVNILHDPKKAFKYHFTLIDSEDYFKSVQCFTNEKKIITGLIFISVKGVIAKAGAVNTTRTVLGIDRDEHPACLYGSFNQLGIELFGVQVGTDKK